MTESSPSWAAASATTVGGRPTQPVLAQAGNQGVRTRVRRRRPAPAPLEGWIAPPEIRQLRELSTFGNGPVEHQNLLLVGRLKCRCPPFKVNPSHRRGCPLAGRIA